jgi:uncharacterized membrane protein YdbT with pleckstrin-like domain
VKSIFATVEQILDQQKWFNCQSSSLSLHRRCHRSHHHLHPAIVLMSNFVSFFLFLVPCPPPPIHSFIHSFLLWHGYFIVVIFVSYFNSEVIIVFYFKFRICKPLF